MFTTRRVATWAVIASTLIAGWEGLDLVTKPDQLANGLPTVCYGATKAEIPNLKNGDRFTKDQCIQLLADALPKYDAGIQKCIHVPMSDERHAAVVSLAYNIGVGAVCRSTFVKHLNAGDPNACEYMLVFNKSMGVVRKGLVNRRNDEYKHCIKG
jgi:lysozyme